MIFLLVSPPAPPEGSLEWLSPILMVAGVLVLLMVLTMSIRGRVSGRAAPRADPREAITEMRSTRGHHEDIDTRAADFLDTTRRLAAQLDNKAERLEQLIQTADDKLAALARATAASAPVTPVPRSPSVAPPRPAPDPAPAPPTHHGSDPLTRSVYELSDAGHLPPQIARQLDEQIGKVELILALRER